MLDPEEKVDGAKSFAGTPPFAADALGPEKNTLPLVSWAAN